MNGLAAWGPTIVAAVTMVFSMGLWAGTVRSHSRMIAKLDQRVDGHDEKLEGHSSAIASFEAWRDGYNAAVFKKNKEATA